MLKFPLRIVKTDETDETGETGETGRGLEDWKGLKFEIGNFRGENG